MGGRTPTSWKPGQSGNPAGRPKDSVAQKLAKSVVADATNLTSEDMPAADAESRTGRPDCPVKARKLTDSEVREGLRALLPAALLRMERDIMSGGEKASQQARYVLDQVIGKPTETVKHTGEGPGWEIRIGRVPDRTAKADQAVNSAHELASNGRV